MRFFYYLLIYLGCARFSLLVVFSLVVGNVNDSLVVVCTLLIAVTSLVAEVMWASVLAALWLSSCGFLALGHRLSSFGAWA